MVHKYQAGQTNVKGPCYTEFQKYPQMLRSRKIKNKKAKQKMSSGDQKKSVTKWEAKDEKTLLYPCKN